MGGENRQNAVTSIQLLLSLNQLVQTVNKFSKHNTNQLPDAENSSTDETKELNVN